MAQPDAVAVMEPPIGTKKPKKQKLSKAERKRLKQLAELELKKRLMREQLLRELELTKKSLKRGKSEWEGTCDQIKVKEFRDEVKVWGEKTERLLQKKDEKIEMLLKNVDETQELQERSISHHLEQLEYLSKCHATFKEAATALYEMQASEMIQDFMLEFSSVQEVQDGIKFKNENIVHMTNILAKDRLRKDYEYFMEQKYDKATDEIETRYVLRDETVKKMSDLQKQLLFWMKELEGDMIDVRKNVKFVYFMQRQKNYVKEATKLNEIERFCRKTISDLQNQLLNIETTFYRRMYALKLEQAYFCEVRSLIKKSIEGDKRMTHNKLLLVASASHGILNILKEFVKNGELLLSMAVCCRKYKTEKEKVVPFAAGPVDIDPDSDYLYNMKFDIMKHLDITEEELVEHIQVLQNFWQRLSDVKLHNFMLMDERKRLSEENEKYRNVIRSFKKSDDVQYILESLYIKPVEIDLFTEGRNLIHQMK